MASTEYRIGSANDNYRSRTGFWVITGATAKTEAKAIAKAAARLTLNPTDNEMATKEISRGRLVVQHIINNHVVTERPLTLKELAQ